MGIIGSIKVLHKSAAAFGDECYGLKRFNSDSLQSMNKLLKHLLLLGALSLSLAAAAGQTGQLPLRIVTGEVEQPSLFGPDTPEFRRSYAALYSK